MARNAKSPTDEEKLEALKKEIADNGQCILVLRKQAKKLEAINAELENQYNELKNIILVKKITSEAKQEKLSVEDYLANLKNPFGAQ